LSRSFSSSIGRGGGEKDDQKPAVAGSNEQHKHRANENVHALYEDDSDSANNDDDDEGWVPPVRDRAGAGSNSEENGATQSTSSTSLSLPTSERIETILEVSRQVKEQERLDRAVRETEREAEALFQLTEEEQASLTEEEILERLAEVLKREEELEEEIFRKELEREEAQNEREKLKMKQLREQQQQLQQQEAAPDWLQTRRALQGNEENILSSSSSSVVSVIHHTQLTANEIKSLLEEHRGRDITIIEDDPEAPRMGGAAGMIFCTGGGGSSSTNSNNSNSSFSGFMDSNPYLISTLSRVLIDHMKDRKLHEIGTAPSAQQNTKNRSPATQTPSLYGSSSSSSSITAPESWKIVDCGNYIVHILDEATRKDLRLEDLWSGFDPLWRLNILDEEAVDDYCAQNPVPAEYDGTTGSRRHGRPSLYGDDRRDGNDTNSNANTNTTNDSSSSLDFDGSVLKRLQRNQFGFTRRHRPVIPQAIKNRNRRAGRKQRRLQKERAYFGDSD